MLVAAVPRPAVACSGALPPSRARDAMPTVATHAALQPRPRRRGALRASASASPTPSPSPPPPSPPPASPPTAPATPEVPQVGQDTLLGGATGLFQPAHGGVGALRSLLRGGARGATRLLTAPARWLSARRAAVSWAAANEILEAEVLPAVRAAMPAVAPFRTKYADASREDAAVPFAAADGALVGEVAVYKGAPVDWLCVARVWSRARGFGSARLDVFLDGSTSAPHLQIHITVLPSGAYLLFFDCPPRVDLVLNDAYLSRVYLTPPPGRPRALADIVAGCLRQPDAYAPFISRDGTVRAFMASPAVMLFTVQPGRKGTERVRSLARELTAAWAALAVAPLPEAERATLDAEALRRRDVAIRDFVRRDPDTKNLVPVLGGGLTDMLMQLLAGTQQGGA